MSNERIKALKRILSSTLVSKKRQSLSTIRTRVSTVVEEHAKRQPEQQAGRRFVDIPIGQLQFR
ncbi:hypothetical protein N7471_000323 [Penicillium samsonianum]|uniref:uncharacterized protein n=1 Tax=Penicillium samsonianum TaxID=1882272 RepID=UPI0025499106|nr:uncharacterized protein N7471_000323 [Penicillium samsonianum]KAJ6149124.1 hypothetical protein N7471_000323 [Penicillium samsonianum]